MRITYVVKLSPIPQAYIRNYKVLEGGKPIKAA